MPLNIIGTLPFAGFPLTVADCLFKSGKLFIGSESVPIIRGTAALLAAACLACDFLGLPPPKGFIAGDIGLGDGSRSIYAHLEDHFPDTPDQIMTFHYLQPDVDWHNRILMQIEALAHAPTLVADAGYMYVAKMSGFASSYDLFTPDAGEMAFLADESAPHPFYTRGFLLQEENDVSDLIARAYDKENASRYLLIKGKKDIVASKKGIISEISQPSIENMEPIGGTGDTLTGITSALTATKMTIPDAAATGALVNRYLGEFSNPTPASGIQELLSALPKAMNKVLR
jgi:hypothetical protein